MDEPKEESEGLLRNSVAEYERRIAALTRQRDDARKLATYNDLGLKETQARLEQSCRVLTRHHLSLDAAEIKVWQPVDVGKLQEDLTEVEKLAHERKQQIDKLQAEQNTLRYQAKTDRAILLHEQESFAKERALLQDKIVELQTDVARLRSGRGPKVCA